MKLLDYTERSNAVDHWNWYNMHVDTPAVKKAVQNRKSQLCPFCSEDLDKVCHFTRHFSASINDDHWISAKASASVRGITLPNEYYGDFITYSCSCCGWWRVENHQPPLNVIDYIFPTLKKYAVSSKELPVDILWTELLKKPEILYSINHGVFEKFVGSVMGSVLGVEVTHVGKTGDGGIDLFYCQGNEEFAVQVKRRTKNDSTEGVALVREFLGAMLLGNYTGGVIVSTADHYTSGAVGASLESKRKGLVSTFELIDRKEFLMRFEYNPKRGKYPWEHVFNDVATTSQYDYPYKMVLNKSSLIKT